MAHGPVTSYYNTINEDIKLENEDKTERKKRIFTTIEYGTILQHLFCFKWLASITSTYIISKRPEDGVVRMKVLRNAIKIFVKIKRCFKEIIYLQGQIQKTKCNQIGNNMLSELEGVLKEIQEISCLQGYIQKTKCDQIGNNLLSELEGELKEIQLDYLQMDIFKYISLLEKIELKHLIGEFHLGKPVLRICTMVDKPIENKIKLRSFEDKNFLNNTELKNLVPVFTNNTRNKMHHSKIKTVSSSIVLDLETLKMSVGLTRSNLTTALILIGKIPEIGWEQIPNALLPERRMLLEKPRNSNAYQDRLHTFTLGKNRLNKRWSNDKFVYADILVGAGFSYEGEDDIVVCKRCNCRSDTRLWGDNDETWAFKMHRKGQQKPCPFLETFGGFQHIHMTEAIAEKEESDNTRNVPQDKINQISAEHEENVQSAEHMGDMHNIQQSEEHNEFSSNEGTTASLQYSDKNGHHEKINSDQLNQTNQQSVDITNNNRTNALLNHQLISQTDDFNETNVIVGENEINDQPANKNEKITNFNGDRKLQGG